MTREQIENMPAGREVDALIWMALNNQKPDLLMCRFVDGDYQPHADCPVGHISPPHYSRDIMAAGDIVAELSEVYLEKSKGKFFCMIGDDFDNSAEAETAPLAICRAFLLYKTGE